MYFFPCFWQANSRALRLVCSQVSTHTGGGDGYDDDGSIDGYNDGSINGYDDDSSIDGYENEGSIDGRILAKSRRWRDGHNRASKPNATKVAIAGSDGNVNGAGYGNDNGNDGSIDGRILAKSRRWRDGHNRASKPNATKVASAGGDGSVNGAVYGNDDAKEAKQSPDADEVAAKWVSIAGGAFDKKDMFCADIRRLQQRCGCSDLACNEVLNMFKKYLGVEPSHLRSVDRKLQNAAGAFCLRLHGCTACQRHVYVPDDKTGFCPRVKDDGTVCGHPRYDASGRPNEVGNRI